MCGFGGKFGKGTPESVNVGKTTYKGYTSKGNYSEWQRFCKQKGSVPATCKTNAEFKAIKNLINKSKRQDNYWVDAKIKNGEMKWTDDGSLWNDEGNFPPAWLAGEPDAEGACGAFDGTELGLHGIDCKQSLSFMCKYEKKESSGGGDGGGVWVPGPTQTVEYLTYMESGTREECDQFCRAKGGTMAIINTKQKFDVLFNILSGDPYYSTYWTDAKMVGGTYVWSDGMEYDAKAAFAKAWKSGQPAFNGDCSMWVGGKPSNKINSGDCNADHKFLCEFVTKS